MKYVMVFYVLLSTGNLWALGAHLRIRDGRPIVESVFVNGHGPYAFVVDTGTTFNHLDPEIARSIGLRATFRGEVVSSSGIRFMPGASGVEVTLELIHQENQSFFFAGMDTVHRLSSDLQGVLGQAFFSGYDYLLDLKNRRFEIGKRGPGDPGPKKVRIPLRTVHGRPVIDTNLGPLVLDSGTNWITLFGVEAGEDTHEMVTMTGAVEVGFVFRTLFVGGHIFWRGNAIAGPN
jgi:hypothetical protein